MVFSTNFLLVLAAVFLAVLVNQTESNLLGLSINFNLIQPNKENGTKTELSGDRNIVMSNANAAIAELIEFDKLYTRAGPLGQAKKIFTEKWGQTIKMVADVEIQAFDLISSIFGKKIVDKEAALFATIKGIHGIKKAMYHSGGPAHGSLGTAKPIVNYAYKGGLKFLIDKIQQCGTDLFEGLEIAKLFIIRGINSNNDEVLQKCIKAANSAILSSAVTGNANLLAGIKKAIEYIANVDDRFVVEKDPIEDMMEEKTKAAAALDSFSVIAIKVLNADFEDAQNKGIKAPILAVLKDGLLKYIQHCALSLAVANDALAQAKTIAMKDEDPEVAIRAIHIGILLSKDILIEGSVKAYMGLGAAGKLSGLTSAFETAVEIVENSRVEATKGVDAAAKLAISGIKTGGEPMLMALDSAKSTLEAVQAVVYGQIADTKNFAFKVLKQ